jgi:hypothetical protein
MLKGAADAAPFFIQTENLFERQSISFPEDAETGILTLNHTMLPGLAALCDGKRVRSKVWKTGRFLTG